MVWCKMAVPVILKELQLLILFDPLPPFSFFCTSFLLGKCMWCSFNIPTAITLWRRCKSKFLYDHSYWNTGVSAMVLLPDSLTWVIFFCLPKSPFFFQMQQFSSLLPGPVLLCRFAVLHYTAARFHPQRGYLSLISEVICMCGMKSEEHFRFSVADWFLQKRRYNFPEGLKRWLGKGFWAIGQCVQPPLCVSECWLRHCCSPFPLCPVDEPQSWTWLTAYQWTTV